MVKMGKGHRAKHSNFVWLDMDKQNYIEDLREPYGDMIASNKFIEAMINYFLSKKEILEAFMKDFNEKYKKEIIKFNIDIPKTIIEKTETIKVMTCPVPTCSIDFKSLKELNKHLQEKHGLKSD